MEKRLETRLKAFGVHLFVSAVVISLFLAILFTRWYPSPYFEMASVWDVVKLVIVVDLILGPFVTLIVFDIRKGRKELTRDLFIVVAIQLSALAWGVGVTYQGRPAYLAFSDDEFQTVILKQIDEKALPEGIPVVGLFSQPQPVFVRPITDPAEGLQLFMEMAQGQSNDISFQPDRYLPYQSHLPEILSHARDIHQAVSGDTTRQELLDGFLKSSGRSADELAFFPVFSYGKKGVLAIERATGEVVGYLAMVI